jgi:stress-induced morphogen
MLELIQKRLQAAFSRKRLEVFDDSHGAGHFTVNIQATAINEFIMF